MYDRPTRAFLRCLGIECERDRVIEPGLSALLPCGGRRGLAERGARLPQKPFEQRTPEDVTRKRSRFNGVNSNLTS